MIYTGQTYVEGNKPSRSYDEMWNIMLYPTKGLKCETLNHPELAPSKDIFNHYQSLKSSGQWNQEAFDSWYVEAYIKEIAERPSAVDSLNYLYKHRLDKNIILLCACPHDEMCHRSIVRGMLVGACGYMCKSTDGIWLDLRTNSAYYLQYIRERERVRHLRGEL